MDRTWVRGALAVMFAVHGVISLLAMREVGYVGIFTEANLSWASRQVFSDLVVSLAIVSFWLVPDARRLGINPWPYVVAMLPLGSFAPLAYLVWREVALAGRPASAPTTR